MNLPGSKMIPWALVLSVVPLGPAAAGQGLAGSHLLQCCSRREPSEGSSSQPASCAGCLLILACWGCTGWSLCSGSTPCTLTALVHRTSTMNWCMPTILVRPVLLSLLGMFAASLSISVPAGSVGTRHKPIAASISALHHNLLKKFTLKESGLSGCKQAFVMCLRTFSK